jgi:hypothetical protein
MYIDTLYPPSSHCPSGLLAELRSQDDIQRTVLFAAVRCSGVTSSAPMYSVLLVAVPKHNATKGFRDGRKALLRPGHWMEMSG